MRKLNKAVVATVLAGSGVAVTAPVLPTKANTQFNDLNPDADYYQPVMELASRGYISGYKDGSFRPNQAITRGQAAKMLAMALNLNSTNPTNPGFRDVPTNHDFYKYIAALANAGIISGFDDKTFRPNEPINRNQMAKILTLGYKFQVSTKQTHGFADVSESNANRYFIQTLYDLGITKGTTGNTYSPFGSVTRGQLATFIVRAENTSAEKVKPVKEIGEVVGADVYINGIKYRVDASLRDIINDTNAAALKGAHIEGQIVGETLKTISSLTLNAQGTANRMLTFDGNNTTFTGELKVQGNYILFKNWTLSGPVTIAETPRRTLSDLANVRIASLTGFGFIDWGKPTDTTEQDDDPTYNGGGNDLTDKPAIDTGGRNVDRMPVTEKYVDFSNSLVKRLIIEANRTYVASTNKIPYVNVQGWVRQFEIYANIGTLYIEPDVKTTMFGVGDIDTIYKNSFKDVFLNTDSHVKLMVVDHSGGWIDLGDYVYIDKVIIPPNKMPNDIFNDFIKDNDKIGDIEDPSGNDIDRDPIENTIIPDMEAPTAQIGEIKVQGSSMTAGIKSSEDGEYFYTIRKADDRIPTMREIIEEAETTTLKTSGTGWLDKDVEKTITASDLDENAEYVLHLVTKDEADNYSDKISKAFTTMDGTPPRIDNLQATALTGGTRAKITFNPSETGVYKYMVVKADDRVPTLQEMLELPENEITVDKLSGVEFIHTGLSANTEYRVYMIMIDNSKNQSAYKDEEITMSNSFLTGPLDNVRPELAKTQLDNTDILNPLSEPTTVILTFNEELDKETAENVKNYTLGGTGNLTGNPYTAKLSNDGKKVTLTIPSMAAFVNNDTLTVRIKNVTDNAGNVILDDGKVNQAIYTYQRVTTPVLSNIVVNSTVTGSNNAASNKVTFNANYTGTYYYLIMPANPGEDVKKPSVSQVVFPEDNYTDDQVFMKDMKRAAGSGEAVEGDGAKLERGNLFNIEYDQSQLDSENGYYIYMVLRDRHGNYSNVEAQYFLPNKRDFTLVDFEFAENPTEANSTEPAIFYYEDGYTSNQKEKRFVFNMEFDVEMDPKSFTMSNAKFTIEGELAKYLEVKSISLNGNDSKKATLSLGYKNIIDQKDLPVAETLVEYYLTNGQDMNITIGGLKSWATGKLEEVTGEKVTAGTVAVDVKYEDRVKPRLLNVDAYSRGTASLAYRVNDNFETSPTGKPILEFDQNGDGNFDRPDDKLKQLPAQLELTFSEPVKLPTGPSFGDFATLFTKPELGPGPGSTLSINSIAFAKDENGNEIKNKLVITIQGSFQDKERLEMTLKDTPNTSQAILRDMASNTILINPDNPAAYKAVYVYREMPMTIDYANLGTDDSEVKPQPSPNGYVYESRGIEVGLTGGYKADGMRLYYMQGTHLSGNITAQTIINATSDISDTFGNKEITSLGAGLVFEAPLGTGESSQLFRNRYAIYIVLTDSYGNVSNVVSQQIMVRPEDIHPRDTTTPRQ